MLMMMVVFSDDVAVNKNATGVAKLEMVRHLTCDYSNHVSKVVISLSVLSALLRGESKHKYRIASYWQYYVCKFI